MILLDDKQAEAVETRSTAEPEDQEPPPTYASLHSSSNTPKTVNYVSITREHNSVKETLIVDPSLFVPQFLRPPLLPGETEATRKNLHLESTHGHVYADITLVDTGTPDGNTVDLRRKRVVMKLVSSHGGITAKVHGALNRPSFHLRANSAYGDISLHLPRTFHGPIIVSYRHGSMRFSEAIDRNLTTFGEMDHTRRCFLGDFSQYTEAGGGWTGDELFVDVKHGYLKLQYDDDAVGITPLKTRPTLLNRIFGF